MRKVILTATCVLCSLVGVRAQVVCQSLVIHSHDGQVHTFDIGATDSITFTTEPSRQHCQWYQSVENPAIADYLRDFEYDANDYSYHHIFDYRGEPYLDARQDWPYGVTLGDTTYYNLIPGRTYRLARPLNDSRDTVCIQTLGQLRMIRADGIDNVRDLGGWPTADGQRVRYGRIYRGTELNTLQSAVRALRSQHQITDADAKMLRKELCVVAELDLRGDAEIPLRDVSALGTDIRYFHAPISYTDLKTPGNRQLMVECLRFINSVISKDTGAIYLHCVWGADRTGLLCLMLEGLLGVKQSDLDKDYEITSFSGNTRYRTNTNYRNALQNVLNQQGETLQQKFRNWWLESGATDEDLSIFCQSMTE